MCTCAAQVADVCCGCTHFGKCHRWNGVMIASRWLSQLSYSMFCRGHSVTVDAHQCLGGCCNRCIRGCVFLLAAADVSARRLCCESYGKRGNGGRCCPGAVRTGNYHDDSVDDGDHDIKDHNETTSARMTLRHRTATTCTRCDSGGRTENSR